MYTTRMIRVYGTYYELEAIPLDDKHSNETKKC